MLFVFSNISFTVSHDHKTLPWAFLYKCIKTQRRGEFHWRHSGCSSVDGLFRWPAECRGEAEHLLGSCCKGPSSPWKNQPSLWGCTALWIVHKPLQAVNLSHKPLRNTGQSGSSLQQAGREAAKRLHKSIFSGFAIVTGGKGGQKTKSTGRRWWRVLVKSGTGFWTEPGLNSAPSSSQDPKQQEFWLNSGCWHQVLHDHALL